MTEQNSRMHQQANTGIPAQWAKPKFERVTQCKDLLNGKEQKYDETFCHTLSMNNHNPLMTTHPGTDIEKEIYSRRVCIKFKTRLSYQWTVDKPESKSQSKILQSQIRKGKFYGLAPTHPTTLKGSEWKYMVQSKRQTKSFQVDSQRKNVMQSTMVSGQSSMSLSKTLKICGIHNFNSEGQGNGLVLQVQTTNQTNAIPTFHLSQPAQINLIVLICREIG